MTEPFFTEVPSTLQMTVAYNWYAENKTWADSKKYIVQYLIENGDVELGNRIKKGPDNDISWVCGWICRLINQGSKINPESKWYLDFWLNSLKINIKKES